MDSLNLQQVARRRAQLPEWMRQGQRELAEFGAALGLAPPEQLLERPLAALPLVERLLREEDVGSLAPDARQWLEARLLRYVAQVIASDHGGDWAVDGVRGSPSYGRYVIEVPDGEGRPVRRVDPAAIVADYLAEPPGRSLVRWLAMAEDGG